MNRLFFTAAAGFHGARGLHLNSNAEIELPQTSPVIDMSKVPDKLKGSLNQALELHANPPTLTDNSDNFHSNLNWFADSSPAWYEFGMWKNAGGSFSLTEREQAAVLTMAFFIQRGPKPAVKHLGAPVLRRDWEHTMTKRLKGVRGRGNRFLARMKHLAFRMYAYFHNRYNGKAYLESKFLDTSIGGIKLDKDFVLNFKALPEVQQVFGKLGDKAELDIMKNNIEVDEVAPFLHKLLNVDVQTVSPLARKMIRAYLANPGDNVTDELKGQLDAQLKKSPFYHAYKLFRETGFRTLEDRQRLIQIMQENGFGQEHVFSKSDLHVDMSEAERQGTAQVANQKDKQKQAGTVMNQMKKMQHGSVFAFDCRDGVEPQHVVKMGVKSPAGDSHNYMYFPWGDASESTSMVQTSSSFVQGSSLDTVAMIGFGVLSVFFFVCMLTVPPFVGTVGLVFAFIAMSMGSAFFALMGKERYDGIQ